MLFLGYSPRDHGDSSDVRSTRSTRTTRLREDTSSTSSSTRNYSHTSADTTTRTTTATRRLREERASTPSGRTHTRSERTVRSTNTSTERSPTRSTRTTRSSRQTTDTTPEQTTVDSIRARREARRKRNQEHDDKQNKITVENGDRDRISRSKKDVDSQDRQEKDDDTKIGNKEERQADKDIEGHDVGINYDNYDKSGDLAVEKSGSDVNEDATDRPVIEETERTDENKLKTENIPTEIEKLVEHTMVEGHDTIDKDDTALDVKMGEVSSKDSTTQNKLKEDVENDGMDTSTTESSVTEGEKHDEVIGEKASEDIEQVDSEVKQMKNANDKEEKENKKSSETEEVQDIKSDNTVENVENVTIAADLLNVKLEDENMSTEEKQTPDVPTSMEYDVEANVVEEIREELSLESSPAETAVAKELTDADNGPANDEESAPLRELEILEELPEITVLEDDISNKISIETDEKESMDEITKDTTGIASDEVAIPVVSVIDGEPQRSERVADKQKTVSPVTSPKKSKPGAKSDEAGPKSSKSRTKSDVSSTKSDEVGTKNERLRTKSDISKTESAETGTKVDEVETSEDKSSTKSEVSRTRSAELGTNEPRTDKVSTKNELTRTKSAESGKKTSVDGATGSEHATKISRTGKQKVGDDAWKRNVRKKKGVSDVDRAVELRVLGRTGKIKNKMKTCETRDVESAEQWKREVKKSPRKHKSFDEETEKELRELSNKRDLKNIVQSCEEKDKESADAWKREVRQIYSVYYV